MTLRARATLVALALVLITALLLSMAGCTDDSGEGQEPTWSEIDWPDCDKEDRSPTWDTADCGQSPAKGVKIVVSTTPKVNPTKTAKTPGTTVKTTKPGTQVTRR